ncbi:chemotaxis protein CheC [Parvibium lacunae]|nr:chemotaxis protein CheC [Parvibium lacunae]
MMQLTELQQDALAETFNISLGEAAAALSTLVNEEVLLSIPVVELIPAAELAERLDPRFTQSDRVCGVHQEFTMPDQANFRTDTLLLFGERGGMEVVRLMLGHAAPIGQITELEQEALSEVGNIIINACTSAIANLFRKEMIGSLPTIAIANNGEAILPKHDPQDTILVSKINLEIKAREVNGYVVYMMDLASLGTFVKNATQAFGLPDGA